MIRASITFTCDICGAIETRDFGCRYPVEVATGMPAGWTWVTFAQKVYCNKHELVAMPKCCAAVYPGKCERHSD